MPKTGKNVYKRKDGRWEGRYAKDRNTNGKIIYGSVYGKTCSEVKRRLSTFVSCDTSQATPVAVALTKSDITFSDVAAQWLSIIALKVKSSTYAGYAASLNLHILPLLGQRKIQDLTAVDVSRFAKVKLESGRADGKGGLSSKTVRDLLSIVKAVVDFAFKENIINSGFTITYPKQHQRAMRVLSRQEQSSLEAVLNAELDIHKLGILLCLYTGLRVGEICAMRWQDISSDYGTLYVSKTLQRVKCLDDESDSKTKIHIDTPKSQRSAREIPIPKFLSPHLQGFARNKRAYLLSTDEIAVTEPRTMQNHFARSVRAANLVGVNFHATRHTFATRCIEAGVDIKSLSEILGHASVNITLNRYVHSSSELKREGMNKLEQYIGM